MGSNRVRISLPNDTDQLEQVGSRAPRVSGNVDRDLVPIDLTIPSYVPRFMGHHQRQIIQQEADGQKLCVGKDGKGCKCPPGEGINAQDGRDPDALRLRSLVVGSGAGAAVQFNASTGNDAYNPQDGRDPEAIQMHNLVRKQAGANGKSAGGARKLSQPVKGKGPAGQCPAGGQESRDPEALRLHALAKRTAGQGLGAEDQDSRDPEALRLNALAKGQKQARKSGSSFSNSGVGDQDGRDPEALRLNALAKNEFSGDNDSRDPQALRLRAMTMNGAQPGNRIPTCITPAAMAPDFLEVDMKVDKPVSGSMKVPMPSWKPTMKKMVARYNFDHAKSGFAGHLPGKNEVLGKSMNEAILGTRIQPPPFKNPTSVDLWLKMPQLLKETD